MIKRLIHVSIALDERGGGAALLGRLNMHALAAYGAERAIPYRLLHLGAPTCVVPAAIAARHYHGRQYHLLSAIWRAALLGRGTLLVFDHPGPARAVGILPSGLRPRYCVWMLGIEVWSKLSVSRRLALRHASQRLAISAYTAQRASSASPWLPPVAVIHPALEERPCRDAPDEALLRRAGHGFVLIIGRIMASERYKGHDALLEVLGRVAHRVPDVRLVVVGEGDDLSRLQATAQQLGVADRVVFTGFVSESTRNALLERCGVFAMPSSGEGFGLVFLEAMRASKPAIGLARSAAAEIIIDGETGFLVDQGNHPQLAAALVRVLTQPDLARSLGAAGYRRWRTHFSFERFQAQLWKQLDRLRGAPDA